MKKLCSFVLSLLLMALFLVGCGTDEESTPVAHFLIATSGHPSIDGYFIVRTSNPELIAKARSQIGVTEDDMRLFVDGILLEGDGGHNVGWSWHFDPGKWDLVESTIELCDASPRMVEDAWEEWIGRQFCPWSSYVLAELPPGP